MPGPRLRAAADPAGAAAAQAHRSTCSGCPAGSGARSRETRALLDELRRRRRRRVRRLRGAAGLPRRPAGEGADRRARAERAAGPGQPDRRPVRRAGGGHRRRARRCTAREHVGMPLRTAISSLDRAAPPAPRRAAAFGLDADRPTLLVFGGSQGAATLNRAAVARRRRAHRRRGAGAARARAEEHRRDGSRRARRVARPTWSWTIWSAWTSPTPPPTSRCAGPGAMTVAELSAVGLPAAFVPLPIGNGEQRAQRPAGGRGRRRPAGRGRRPRRRRGSQSHLVPLLTDPVALAGYAAHAAAAGVAGRRRAAGRHRAGRWPGGERRGRRGLDGPGAGARPSSARCTSSASAAPA